MPLLLLSLLQQVGIDLTVDLCVVLLDQTLHLLNLLVTKVLPCLIHQTVTILKEARLLLCMVSLLHLYRVHLHSQLLSCSLNVSLQSTYLLNVLDLVVSLLTSNLLLFDPSHYLIMIL